MAIRFSSVKNGFELPDAEKVRRWVAEVIVRRGKQVGSINYLFSDDEEVLRLNRQFLDHDTYTDIITFDTVHADLVNGDIIISVDRVGENASTFGVPFEQELHRVVIHGVLHLLGQGDKTESEAAEMRRQEGEALRLWDEMFRVEHDL